MKRLAAFLLSVSAVLANASPAVSQRYAISAAFCLDGGWTLVVLDKATGKKVKMNPRAPRKTVGGLRLESFNPSGITAVIRTEEGLFTVKSANPSAKSAGLAAVGKMPAPDANSGNSDASPPVISRNVILENIRNLN